MALVDDIRKHAPEMMLFLSVGIGYFIGKLKIGPVQLGGVCGTLIASLLIGQLGFNIDPSVKNLFFAVFIFALGYAGGPQFFANLNAKGLRLGIFSLIEVIAVFVVVMTAVYIFKFDAGTAAGIVAGSATESAVIGTASEAISHLPISKEEVLQMQSNIATAYSVTYIFGLLGIVVFTSQIAPLLLKADLKQEAETLWLKLSGANAKGENAEEEIVSAVYEVSFAAGKNVAQLAQLLGPRVRLEKLQRGGKEIEITPDVVLEKKDIALFMGDQDKVVKAGAVVGVECGECGNADGFNFTVKYLESILTNKEIIGKKLGEIQEKLRFSETIKGVYLAGVKRGEHWLPLVADLEFAAGDIIRFYGEPEAIEKVAALVGKAIKTTDRTNFVFAGLGIICGMLLGSLGVHAGAIFVTLGTGGGVLVVGLVFGWYQSKNPDIQGIPASAVEIMKDLGLSVFIACVGISAGPSAIKLIMQYGLILPAVGICVTLIPAIISLFVGRYILKLELPVLLGGIAGQQCSTPALSAVQASAGNSTPLLGYTITYAISNVFLPLLGPILVGAIGAIK